MTASLKRHPRIVAAWIALGAVVTFLLVASFVLDFPLQISAARMQSALHEAFPDARFDAGVPVDDKLRSYIAVDVFFIGDERKQVEVRDWLAAWKVQQEPTGPIMLRFRDPEYPIDPEHPRWLNHFQL